MERQSILVVEDEAIVRESIRDWLAEGGYEVATAEDGEQALKMIGEQEFGVLVLDLKLPGKDGLQVLREAKERQPQVKGVIITAYPSVETAVEAMKLGAIDYLPKPFAPDALERLIEETLGPITVEIKPKVAVEEKVAEAVVVEKPVVEEVIAITEEEVLAHLNQAKAHLKARDYRKAMNELEAILQVAPGNLEARVLIQQAKERLAKPEMVTMAEEGVTEEVVKPKECVWMKLGLVSFRLCTQDYDCLTCEFDQMMQEKQGGESPEIAEALERLKSLPGNQRHCRYALRGDISYRLCTRLFQCTGCEFQQIMEVAEEQKWAKLAARREALRKKEQRAKANA